MPHLGMGGGGWIYFIDNQQWVRHGDGLVLAGIHTRTHNILVRYEEEEEEEEESLFKADAGGGGGGGGGRFIQS